MTALTSAAESIGGFLENDQLRSRWRSIPWIMILTLLIVLTSIAFSLSYTAREDAGVNRQFAAKLALYQEQAERISKIECIKHREAELAAQAALDASLVDAAPRSRALAEVANALTAGLRLVDVSLGTQEHSKGGDARLVASESFCIAPANSLDIKGVAASDAQVSQFLTNLGKSGWLRSVKFISPTGSWVSGIGPRRFEVTAIFEQSASANYCSARAQ